MLILLSILHINLEFNIAAMMTRAPQAWWACSPTGWVVFLLLRWQKVQCTCCCCAPIGPIIVSIRTRVHYNCCWYISLWVASQYRDRWTLRSPGIQEFLLMTNLMWISNWITKWNSLFVQSMHWRIMKLCGDNTNSCGTMSKLNKEKSAFF